MDIARATPHMPLMGAYAGGIGKVHETYYSA
jgi:hypothetical protein